MPAMTRPTRWSRNSPPARCPAFRSFCSASRPLLAIAITLNQLLNLQLFAGIVFIEGRYLYLLAALLLPLVFLAYSIDMRADATKRRLV